MRMPGSVMDRSMMGGMMKSSVSATSSPSATSVPTARSGSMKGKSVMGKSVTSPKSKMTMMTMSFRVDLSDSTNTTDFDEVSNSTDASPTTRRLMMKKSRYLFVENSEEVAAFVVSESKGSRDERRMLMSENPYLRNGGVVINKEPEESSFMDSSSGSNRLLRSLLNDETSTPEPLETSQAMSMRSRMMRSMTSRNRARTMASRMMGAMMGGKSGKMGKGKSAVVEVCLF